MSRPFLCLILAAISLPAQIYVSPAGNDAAPGTKARPLRTFEAAQLAARRAHARNIHFRSGTYYLPRTLVLTPADSGVTFMAEPGEEVVISGGQPLRLQWTPWRNGILQARVPAGFHTDQLFVNGQRQWMARYPNYDPQSQYFNGWAADAFSKERAARWANPAGGFMHAMHRNMWGDFHYQITGKAADGALQYVGGWQNNRQLGMHDKYRYVENIFEELDAPGEWYLDEKSSTLYFYPPAGLDLSKALVEGVVLRHLIEVAGTREKPVRSVKLDGFTFRHSARSFMENREPLLRSDWTTYRGGALLITGTEDVSLENSTFDQPGGNAVFVSNYNRRVTIRGVHIAGAGANGIAFVGDPAAVRSPLYFGKGKDTQNLSELDRTPGPLTDNYPADSLVEDCLIHETGRVEKQTAPIQISMSESITIRHCSLYDVPRAGINISEGTWGGHVIEYCDIFDTVKETGDHGSFNSWGRDRWWGLKGIDLNALSTPDERALPTLDARKTTIIRNNRWRCDHGWDIDLDDGSSNYEIVNNLCLRGGIKLREGFGRRMENNIMVDNSFHPHVWYKGSGDVVRHNIVFGAYKPIRVPTPWGQEIDFNLLHQSGATGVVPATMLQAQSGRDANSLVADAMFVDAARGDYRVREGSPALSLGFHNFPMDQFGVRKPSLRAQARTPVLPGNEPGPASTLQSARDKTPRNFLGATVRNVSGMGEVSAAGLPGEVGLLVLEAPRDSDAYRQGIRKDDVILDLSANPLHVYRGQTERLLHIGKRTDWQGFPRYDFQLAGSTVTLVAPLQPADGAPWLWRGEFFGAFTTVDEALLKLGWHVAYLAAPNTFGSPDTMRRWSALYDELTGARGFSPKPVLLGMSRGGLYVYNWAAAHPDQVGLIYGDAPVCDVKSWPGGKGKGQGSPRDWELFRKVYGLDEQQALAWKGNPVDILEPIAKARIPIIHVVGDADDVVPWDENTGLLKQRYEALGGHVELIVKPGVGHHPHSLENPAPIVDYILKHRL